jgi:hypothetical protein
LAKSTSFFATPELGSPEKKRKKGEQGVTQVTLTAQWSTQGQRALRRFGESDRFGQAPRDASRWRRWRAWLPKYLPNYPVPARSPVAAKTDEMRVFSVAGVLSDDERACITPEALGSRVLTAINTRKRLQMVNEDMQEENL